MVLGLCSPALALLALLAGDGDWPSFRGPSARGVLEGAAVATEWDVPAGRGVLWRTPVPGLAHSSPVVFGERVFVTTAVSESAEVRTYVGQEHRQFDPEPYGSIRSAPLEGSHRFQLLCFDKRSGELLWTRTASEGVPRSGRHPKGSHAAPTPAVDAERVVASFGSEGLYAYDHAGELLWRVDLGPLRSGFYQAAATEWGFASSPVLHAGRVILQCDVLRGSFLAALDASDGSEVWRVDRDDVPSWGTPTVVARKARTQVVVNGYRHIGGYAFETGAELWSLGGGGDLPVPTPIAVGRLIFVTGAHGRWSPIYAVHAGATGRITHVGDQSEQLAWSHPQGGSDIPTPLVYRDLLYLLNTYGILTCYQARTGRHLLRMRLGGGGASFSASPIASGGHLYLTSEEGQVFVVRAGRKAELASINELGETCMATPAIADGVLFWRTRSHLVAIE